MRTSDRHNRLPAIAPGAGHDRYRREAITPLLTRLVAAWDDERARRWRPLLLHKPGTAPALRVEAVQSEVFIVTATHGGIEALDRGPLVAQTAGLAGRDLSSVELAFGRGVEDEQFGGFSRAV